jgi:hypothetical protein
MKDFPMTANGGSVANGRIVPAIPAFAGQQSKARKRAGASWPFFLVETFHAERTASSVRVCAGEVIA